VPALTGNGLAMRAGMVLEALAARYCISLLVVPLYPSVGVPLPAATLCHQTALLPVSPAGTAPARLGPRPFLARLGRLSRRRPSCLYERGAGGGTVFRGVRFDVIHVFRLATLPYARPYLDACAGHTPQRHLDLDDIESTTHRGLADLYRLNGNITMARWEDARAERYEALENVMLRRVDRVYVCSQRDKEELRGRARAQVWVLPNAVRVPAALPAHQQHDPFRFLFVGTLGYYPNADAVRYFCAEVLPLIRQTTPRDVRVTIVGAGPPDVLRQLASVPDVHLVGQVPDVAPWYREADAVLVPLRAGGGTRIKVLEAFSYRRPVVSTSIGIDGIDAQDEEHVLVGDTAATLAGQCVRLMADPALADRLTTNAFSLLMRAYTSAVVTRTVAACS
jgi:glycosyltransferase involved in cell wall biosynthesis